MTTQAFVVVEGSVTDNQELSYLTINGTPTTFDAQGQFSQPLILKPGMNVVRVEAGDKSGNRTVTAHSVMVAERFIGNNEAIQDALAVRLNRGAFTAIEGFAESAITGPKMEALIMARNPLFEKDYKVFGLTAATVKLEAESVSLGQPDLNLNPVAGALEISGSLPNVSVDVRAYGKGLGLIPYNVRGSVSASQVDVSGQAIVTVDAQGQLTIDLDQVTTTLTGFSFNIRGIPGVLENLVKNFVKGFIEKQAKKIIEDTLPPILNQNIAGLASQPVTQNIFGLTITAGVQPTHIAFDAQGASVVVDGDVAIAPVPGTTVPQSPGSFGTFGAAPSITGNSDVILAVNDDMINRASHAAWQAGLLNYSIDTNNVPVQLPSFINLDAGMLTLFFPALSGKIDTNDAVMVRITSQAAPVFLTKPGQNHRFELNAPELQLDVLTKPATGAPKLVFSMNLQASVDADVSIDANNSLSFQLGSKPLIIADVHAEPIADLNDIALETFVNFVLPPVLQLSSNFIGKGIQIPMIQGFQISNLGLGLAGNNQDFLKLFGNVR